MSFFFNSNSAGKVARSPRKPSKIKNITIITSDTLKAVQKQGCAACTLNREKMDNPKMLPSGSDTPLVYVIGDNPGKLEDKRNKHFLNDSGDLLLRHLGKVASLNDIRYNYCIRCHAKSNKRPTELELECCRLSIEEDIKKTKPKIILGIGEVPLNWVQQKERVGNITQWRGKPFPVNIQGWNCWYLPIVDPLFLLTKRKLNTYTNKITKSPDEGTFKFDIELILDLLEREPIEVQKEGYLDNCDFIMGDGISDLNTLYKRLDRFLTYDSVALDIETNCIRPYKTDSKLLTLAIGTDIDILSFPINHDKAWRLNKHRRLVNNAVKEFLYDKSVIKICQNLKFEQEWFMYEYGKEVLRSSYWDDTMCVAYALDERKKVHSLAFLTMQYLGFNLKRLSAHYKGAIWDWPLKDILPYNAMDSKYTYKVFESQIEELYSTENSRLEITYNYHVDLSSTLVLTQEKGMYTKKKEVEIISQDLDKELTLIVKALNEIREVGRCIRKYGEYNPASSTHNLYILKDLFRVKEVEQYNGKNSTDEHVLEQVSDRIPFAGLLLRYRGLAKLKSTYVDSIDGYTYSDNKMHTNYNHTFTSTGRLSSDDPNNQNWPSRKYKYVRKLIKAKKGHLLASFDYGQIDARNIAIASQDEYYIKALWEGLDIHQDWTERIIKRYPRILDEKAKEFGIDRDNEEKLINRYRKDVKNVWTFPIFYGSDENAVGYHTGLPSKVVQPLFKEFWNVFSGVKSWIEETVKFYNKYGYVETLNGRRRHGPMKKEELINAVIQGTSAEIVGDAMTRCSNLAYPESVENKVWLPDTIYQPFIQIHDDLGFYIPDDNNFEDTALRIARVMCAIPFDWVCVPIVVEMVAGYDWYKQDKYEAIYNSNEIL